MRRSKSRRRFHTERIIRNRQRRARSYSGEFPATEVLPAGRYATGDPHLSCPNPRCHLCHWDKLDPSRRARANRSWRRWDREYE